MRGKRACFEVVVVMIDDKLDWLRREAIRGRSGVLWTNAGEYRDKNCTLKGQSCLL